MNIINVIVPYPHAETWVFDDESRGLKAEPFISGIPEIMDKTIQLALNITERKPFHFKNIGWRVGLIHLL